MKSIKVPKGWILIKEVPTKQRGDFLKWMDGQTVMGDTIKGKLVLYYNRTDYEKFNVYWVKGKVALIND